MRIDRGDVGAEADGQIGGRGRERAQAANAMAPAVSTARAGHHVEPPHESPGRTVRRRVAGEA